MLLIRSKCISARVTLVKNILVSTLDKHAPMIEKQVKGKSCPWLSKQVKTEMNLRDGLLRKARKSNLDADWKLCEKFDKALYKKKRNYVRETKFDNEK